MFSLEFKIPVKASLLLWTTNLENYICVSRLPFLLLFLHDLSPHLENDLSIFKHISLVRI